MSEKNPEWSEKSYAFPFSAGDRFCTGMTLRDYFAGQAMDVILQKLYEMSERTGERYDNVYRIASLASYEYADAMLEARK